MESKTFLARYRVCVDQNGLPVEVGRNSAGATYKAEEVGSGQPVTLVLARARMLEAAAREKLEAEMRAAKQLDHINVARLHDFGFEGEQLVYITEHLEGTTLENWVAAHGPLPIDAGLRIALQVISALGAAAFHRIVHRAINPANLMIVPGQTAEGDWPLIKVLNFGGFAPKFLPSAQSGRASDNSAQFASPEQLLNGVVDFRSEIFSLGCTLWFLITGAAPTTRAAIERASGVPKIVRRLVAQMLSVNPDERPQDPLAIEEHIRHCLTHAGRRQAISRKFGLPLAEPTPAIERPRRIPAKALALAAALLAIGTLAALVLPEHFRTNFFRQAETRPEPIGIPVGIPEASIAPVIPDADNAVASGQVQSSSSPADSAGNIIVTDGASGVPPAPSSSASAIASADTIAPASPQTALSGAPANAQPEQSAPLATNQVPPAGESTAPAPPEEGPAPAASPIAVASADTIATASPPTELSDAPANAQPDQSAPLAANTVPSAGEGTSLPPPAEAPDDVSAGAIASTQQPTANVEPVSKESVTTASPSSDTQRKDTTPAVATKSGSKRRNVAKSAKASKKTPSKRIRLAKGSARPSLRTHSMHARFLGTTADGKWIVRLPSSRIAVVEPPPDRIPESAPRRRVRRIIIPGPPPFRPPPPPSLLFPPGA